MKPVHGDTVSNVSNSSTSCSNYSEIAETHQKSRIDRFFHEKHIPLRESKLLKKLVKTRVLYEELRSQLLSSSLSNSSKPCLNSEQQSSIADKDLEKAGKNNIIALVDIVDKGVLLKPKNISECYKNCNSQAKYGPKQQVQKRIHAREYLASKSSIFSKPSLGVESCSHDSSIRFNTKNIKSDPCTCTLKNGEMIKRKSKDIDDLKAIHREQTIKLNKEKNNKLLCKLKRSKLYYQEKLKSSYTKLIKPPDKVTALSCMTDQKTMVKAETISPYKILVSSTSTLVGERDSQKKQNLDGIMPVKFCDNLEEHMSRNNESFSDPPNRCLGTLKPTRFNNVSKRISKENVDKEIFKIKILQPGKKRLHKRIPNSYKSISVSNKTSRSSAPKISRKVQVDSYKENQLRNITLNNQFKKKCLTKGAFSSCTSKYTLSKQRLLDYLCLPTYKTKKHEYIFKKYKESVKSLHGFVIVPQINCCYKTKINKPDKGVATNKNGITLRGRIKTVNEFNKEGSTINYSSRSEPKLVKMLSSLITYKSDSNISKTHKQIGMQKYLQFKQNYLFDISRHLSNDSKNSFRFAILKDNVKPCDCGISSYKSCKLQFHKTKNPKYFAIENKRIWRNKEKSTRIEKKRGWLMSPATNNALQLHKKISGNFEKKSLCQGIVLNIPNKNMIPQKYIKGTTAIKKTVNKSYLQVQKSGIQQCLETIKSQRTAIIDAEKQDVKFSSKSNVMNNFGSIQVKSGIEQVNDKQNRENHIPSDHYFSEGNYNYASFMAYTGQTKNKTKTLTNKSIYKPESLSKQKKVSDERLTVPFKTRQLAPETDIIDVVNRHACPKSKANKSQTLLDNNKNNLNSNNINTSRNDMDRLYLGNKLLSSIMTPSTIAFKSGKLLRRSSFKLFSSAGQSFNIKSNETEVEINSKFSCEVNLSKQALLQRSYVETTHAKNHPVLDRCDLRHLEINRIIDSIEHPLQIVKPIQVNRQLTGVPSLLKRCFYTMNIQVGSRRVPSKISYKLQDYECEPGVCEPYECDPYECQKIIMQRLMRQVSRISGTKNKSSSKPRLTSFKSNTKTKKIQSRSSRSQKHHVVSKQPLGLTYQTLLRPPQSHLQSHRQAVRVGSTFRFDVEFSKNISGTSPVDKIVKVQPNTAEKKFKKTIHVQKVPKKFQEPKIEKVNREKISTKTTSTRDVGNNKTIENVSSLNSISQNQLEQTTMTTSFLKRCFCTKKLPRERNKDLQIISNESVSTVTEEVRLPVRLEKPAMTQTRHVLEPYECEPGVCLPGSCNPYECLKLIRKRHAKDRSTGTKTRRTKSVSSSLSSSKTSKAGIAQTFLRSISSNSIKQAQSIVPTETAIVRAESNLESKANRQAVRISSTFSFDIEFYKEEQFPSYHRIQAASETIRSSRRKISSVRTGQKAQHTNTRKRSSNSRNFETESADVAIGTMVRRCFCTLKLKKNQKLHKHLKPHVTKVNPPTSERYRKTGSPFSNPVPYLHDRSVMATYKLKTFPYKLHPYECEPGVCVPGECDPYECLERINRRHMDQASITDSLQTRSTLAMIKPRTVNRDNEVQFAAKERKTIKARKFRSKDTKLKPTKIMSRPSGSRQAVKIGSNFSFNVEFHKDKSDNVINSKPKPEPRITYVRPKQKKVKYTASKTSQGISISTKQRKTQPTKTVRATDSQTIHRKMRSTLTGVGPFFKRCFCTLQLQKRFENDLKSKNPPLDNISVGTETMSYKPETYLVNKSTHTRQKDKCEPGACSIRQCDPYECLESAMKRKRYKLTLDPNECEPGVCVPGQCDPYECLERIKLRRKQSKRTGTKQFRSHSVSSTAAEYREIKPMSTQVYVPKEKTKKTNRFYNQPLRKERISYDISPAKQSHKQAVRIGSSFSFNIEFYKDRDRQGVVAHDREDLTEPERIIKIPIKSINKSTRRGTATRESRSIKSTYKKAHVRDIETQSQSHAHSQGTGGAPLLKRCFCTLKLQKIGKEQILSNTQLQTSPATIEAIYKSTGTNINRRTEIIPISARETGTKTKRQIRRRALEPYECEPGVCIPGKCDPYECLERIKQRGMRHSGTGMTHTQTKSMASFTSRGRPTKSMNTKTHKHRRDRGRKHTESHYKIKQPPRSSRALENININNRQAVRLGSDFSFNIEFYKDRSKRQAVVKDRSKTTVSTCSPSICNEPACSPSKCNTSSCTSKCPRKNQGTYDASVHHHRKLQAKRIRTKTRSSSIGRLKRCFCTLTLQRAEVKTTLNSLRTATDRVKTQDKTTITKSKYFSQQFDPYECEPGVCIPGACDPYECLERIKRRRGPYGPCDCLEKRGRMIRRVSRTTETSRKRSREIPASKFMSGFISKKTQPMELSKVDNIVEEPRFKIFKKPHTKNMVKISSNFSFNIEFSRDISFPSSTTDSNENRIERQTSDTTKIIKNKRVRDSQVPISVNSNIIKIKKVKDTQVPISVNSKMTTTDLFKRCFCTKKLAQDPTFVDNTRNTYGSQLFRRCFCSRKLTHESVPGSWEDKNELTKNNGSQLFKKCFCTKNFFKSRMFDKEECATPLSQKVPKRETISQNKPLKNCQCKLSGRTQCACLPKAKIKCLCQGKSKVKCLCFPKEDVNCLCSAKDAKVKCACFSKKYKAKPKVITIARVEIERVKPTLQNNEQYDVLPMYTCDNKTQNKLSAAKIVGKRSCSHKLARSHHQAAKSITVIDVENTHRKVSAPRMMLKCFGSHKLFKQFSSKSVTDSSVQGKTIISKEKIITVKKPEICFCTAKQLNVKSEQLKAKAKDVNGTYETIDRVIKLCSLNPIKAKSETGGPKTVTCPTSLNKPKRTSSTIKLDESYFYTKLAKKNNKRRTFKINTVTCFEKGMPLPSKKYWAKYQIQHPRWHKKNRDRNRRMNFHDEHNKMDTKTSSVSLETIMSYSPNKFHKINTLAYHKSKDASNETLLVGVNSKPFRKCYCTTSADNTSRKFGNEHSDYLVNKINKNDYIIKNEYNKYNNKKLTGKENKLTLKKMQARSKNLAYLELKNLICRCLRIINAKRYKIRTGKCACTQVQNSNEFRRGKLTNCKPQTKGLLPVPDLNDNISCMSKTTQFLTVGLQDQVEYRNSKNTRVIHSVKPQSLNKPHKVNRSFFFNNVMGCISKKKTKLIKVVKVTSDLNNVIGPNNVIYKVEDIVPGASGDYQFGLVLESKGVEKDSRIFSRNYENNKQQAFHNKTLLNHKLSCACISNKKEIGRRQKKYKYRKIACACVLNKKADNIAHKDSKYNEIYCPCVINEKTDRITQKDSKYRRISSACLLNDKVDKLDQKDSKNREIYCTCVLNEKAVKISQKKSFNRRISGLNEKADKLVQNGSKYREFPCVLNKKSDKIARKHSIDQRISCACVLYKKADKLAHKDPKYRETYGPSVLNEKTVNLAQKDLKYRRISCSCVLNKNTELLAQNDSKYRRISCSCVLNKNTDKLTQKDSKYREIYCACVLNEKANRISQNHSKGRRTSYACVLDKKVDKLAQNDSKYRRISCSCVLNKKPDKLVQIDSKLSCICFLYKKENKLGLKKSKYHKKSCPCCACTKKAVSPLKSSSDQRLSCHIMKVCKIFAPRKTNLSLRNVAKCHKMISFINICNLKNVANAKKDNNKNLDIFKKKKCICGSVSCANKFITANNKSRSLEIQKHLECIKKYKQIDARRAKMRKKNDKLKMTQLKTNLNKYSNSLLVIESLLDLSHLATKSVKDVIQSGYRAVKDPKCTYNQVKNMALHPQAALDELKQSCKESGCNSTLKRIRKRLGALSFIHKVKEILESHPMFNYLLHISNKRKRMRPIPLRLPRDGCHIYVSSLRNKPCLWVYYLLPWFYPHCISSLRMFKQLTDIVMFMLAIVAWSPCLLGTELLRAVLCCFICTG